MEKYFILMSEDRLKSFHPEVPGIMFFSKMIIRILVLSFFSEVAAKTKFVIKIADKHCGHPVKAIKTDHGTEFIELKEFTDSKSIIHLCSIVYTPEQNGCIERKSRIIMESARSMIHAKVMNTKLWAETLQTTVYVLNRTGTSTVKDETPCELCFGKSAELNQFRIFGSEVNVHIPKQKRQKPDAKAKKCIFVGYDEYQKGYRVMDATKFQSHVMSDF